MTRSQPLPAVRVQPIQKIPPAAMEILIRLAFAEGGLSIGEHKGDFLVARLSGQLTRLGLSDFSAYAAFLSDATSPLDRRLFIEALTTHTTSFFRETAQFNWMRDSGLPDLVRAGAGVESDLTVWSAACSSGQELFSALMTVAAHRQPGAPALRFAGHGTDLSAAVLRRCERAIYTREEIAGIPIDLRRRFLLSGRADPDTFRIAPELRDRSRWTRANLTQASDFTAIRAHVAMLRNVLIYFDAATRARVLHMVIGRIQPGGYLLTGHSETITASDYGLTAIRPSIYRKEP